MAEDKKKLSFAAKLMIFLFILLLIALGGLFYVMKIMPDENNAEVVVSELPTEKKDNNNTSENQSQADAVKEKVDIIDINSAVRPIAVSINNTPDAVKVQTGLNNAYMVYEVPTEGGTCRMLAFFKPDALKVTTEADENLVGSGKTSDTDIIIGTVRSARHNFLDFCFESDAYFVHFGGSTYAEDDEARLGVDYLNGLYTSGYFFRSNPEDLVMEHTAYTSVARILRAMKDDTIRANAKTAKDTVLLNYSVSDVDLSKEKGAVKCNSINIPYNFIQETTFKYDPATGNYLRFASGVPNVDHETKEQFNTKNIIVQKVTHTMMDDDYCWDIATVGNGEGLYVTNGYAVPITWSKADRNAKTIYKYLDGREINVSDGRTYIEVNDVGNEVTVE